MLGSFRRRAAAANRPPLHFYECFEAKTARRSGNGSGRIGIAVKIRSIGTAFRPKAASMPRGVQTIRFLPEFSCARPPCGPRAIPSPRGGCFFRTPFAFHVPIIRSSGALLHGKSLYILHILKHVCDFILLTFPPPLFIIQIYIYILFAPFCGSVSKKKVRHGKI